jgi:pyruvate,orthophosphate dikinase
MQKNDFVEIFKVMEGLPVTIRLLDPPLHEFLPKEEKDIRKLSKEIGVSFDVLKNKVSSLSEFNPMLGFRGCRLGMVYPEITEMQAKAIIQAAIDVKKAGKSVLPEIEIPVVSSVEEVKYIRELIDNVAKELMKKSGVEIKYKVGTMIELPRACLVADKLARFMDFFSFGTNDLTQTTYGFSRDDAGKFIQQYMENGVLKEDPFQVLDREGVGSLMKTCSVLGRKSNPKIEIGICGEHGGEPSSVEFCHSIGLDYVSCSPFRVPLARLAAAQAKIKHG